MDLIPTLLQSVAAVIALLTLAKGVFEYSSQGRQKRADRFLEMRKRFNENAEFSRLTVLIETNNPAVADYPFVAKRAYLGFFEEIAFLVNSGLLKESVAHYMFGYSVIRCWQSDAFWTRGADRNSPYWSAFRDLAERMLKQQQSFAYTRKAFSA